MPVEKVKDGYKVANTNDKKPMPKAKAEAQLRAIEASKARAGKPAK